MTNDITRRGSAELSSDIKEITAKQSKQAIQTRNKRDTVTLHATEYKSIR